MFDIFFIIENGKPAEGYIHQSIIDQAIDQWRVRLNACVDAKGKHFEHMMCCFTAVDNLLLILKLILVFCFEESWRFKF